MIRRWSVLILVVRALVCGTFDPAPTQRTVILSHRRRISRPPFLRPAILAGFRVLGITKVLTGKRNKSLGAQRAERASLRSQ
jgi:hypothetical protein